LGLLPGKCVFAMATGAVRDSRSRIWSHSWRLEIIAKIMGLAAKLDLLDSAILLSLVAEVERIIVDPHKPSPRLVRDHG